MHQSSEIKLDISKVQNMALLLYRQEKEWASVLLVSGQSISITPKALYSNMAYAMSLTAPSGLLAVRSEVLRSLRHYMRAQSQGHHTIDRLEEGSVERGRARQSSLKGRERATANQTKSWNRFKGDVGETSERLGGAHMGFSERISTILSWSEQNTQNVNAKDDRRVQTEVSALSSTKTLPFSSQAFHLGAVFATSGRCLQLKPAKEGIPDSPVQTPITPSPPSIPHLSFEHIFIGPVVIALVLTMMTQTPTQQNKIAEPKQILSVLHIIFHCLTVVKVLFCSFEKGLTPKICTLCFVVINSVLFMRQNRLSKPEKHSAVREPTGVYMPYIVSDMYIHLISSICYWWQQHFFSLLLLIC